MAVQKIDYLSRDYAGFKNSLLRYAQTVFPEWQPGSGGDFGVVMVDLFSYMGDIISYYTDRAQFENYLPTATQRESILNLAYMLGYVPYSGAAATGSVNLINVAGTATTTVVPAGLQIVTNRVEALDGPLTFETTASVTLPANPTGVAGPVAVNVSEGATESNLYLGPSTGQPGQLFSLPHTGVYRESIRVFVEDVTGTITITPATGPAVTVREWLKVDRLLGSDSNDQVFESRLSTSVTNVFFGDDLAGDIPATGLKIYATYRHGAGAWGNVASGVLRTINVNGLTGLDSVRVAQDANGLYLSSATTGGANEESDQSIRENAPRAFRAQERVVTEEDYKSVVLNIPGVHTASVVVGSFTSVTIFITGPGGGIASAALKQLVIDKLKTRTLSGVIVTVADPTFQPIDFGSVPSPITLYATPGYSLADIKVAAEQGLAAMVGGLSAGVPLAASAVYDVLNSINGVIRADVTLFSRQGAGAQTNTAPITPQPWEILTPGVVTVTVV